MNLRPGVCQLPSGEMTVGTQIRNVICLLVISPVMITDFDWYCTHLQVATAAHGNKCHHRRHRNAWSKQMPTSVGSTHCALAPRARRGGPTQMIVESHVGLITPVAAWLQRLMDMLGISLHTGSQWCECLSWCRAGHQCLGLGPIVYR